MGSSHSLILYILEEKMRYKIWIIVIVSVVFFLTGICWNRIQRNKETTAADYNVSDMAEQKEEDRKGIYAKSESAAVQVDEQFNNMIEEKEAQNFEILASKICQAMEENTDAEIEKMLRKDIVKEKGYAFNRDAIKNLRNRYEKNSRYMPISYSNYTTYCYCIVRVVPKKKFKNGEYGVDYTKEERLTFTIYEDGSFLPFALEHIGAANTGVHKIAASTAAPELLEDAPLIPGIDIVDEKGK